MSGLPRLLYAGSDEVSDPSYCWKGTNRNHSPRVVFQFTRGGVGHLSWGGNTIRLGPGDAFCYNLVDPTISYFYPPAGKDPWSFIYGVFVGMTEMVSRLVKLQGPVFRLGRSSLAARKLQTLLETAAAPVPSIDAAHHFEICAALVGELIRCVEGGSVKGKSALLIRQAGHLIQAGESAPFHLAALAETLQVTPEHLCRAFRNQMGITPKAYHDELRLGRICKRLLNSPADIKAIAAEAGFSDLSHFNKFFKARRGITPGQFRRHAALPA